MDAPHQTWFRTVILLGAVYLVVGITFAALANASPSNEMRVMWRNPARAVRRTHNKPL